MPKKLTSHPECIDTDDVHKSGVSRESRVGPPCELAPESATHLVTSLGSGSTINNDSSSQQLIPNVLNLLGAAFGVANVDFVLEHQANCANPEPHVRQQYSSGKEFTCDCSASLEITLKLENAELFQMFYTTVDQLEKLVPLIGDLVIESAIEKLTRLHPECLVPLGQILRQFLAESSDTLLLQMEVNPRMTDTPDHIRRMGIKQ